MLKHYIDTMIFWSSITCIYIYIYVYLVYVCVYISLYINIHLIIMHSCQYTQREFSNKRLQTKKTWGQLVHLSPRGKTWPTAWQFIPSGVRQWIGLLLHSFLNAFLKAFPASCRLARPGQVTPRLLSRRPLSDSIFQNIS